MHYVMMKHIFKIIFETLISLRRSPLAMIKWLIHNTFDEIYPLNFVKLSLDW
jgi:hypothetical protein